MAEEFVVGLDLGTTNVKAILFTTYGKVVFAAEQTIQTFYSQDHGATQNPEEVEQAARLTLKKVVQECKKMQGKIVAVGFSAAMHTLLFVDARLRPLANMLIWSDGRSQEQVKELLAKHGHAIYERTGTPIHPMNPLVKLDWLKRIGAVAYKDAHFVMTMKDYLVAKWFGVRYIDYSMASSMGLFNIHTYDWDEEALVLAGIDRKQLSELVPPTYVLPKIKLEVAEELGIHVDTPFVIGSADGQLANLGSGAIHEGEVAITVGTSGAVRQFVSDVSLSSDQSTFCYAFTKKKKIIGGPTNNGGVVLQWLKDVLGFQDSFEQFLQLADSVPVGAEGILFLPYVNGERAPLWNQHAKGTFFGLNITHKKEQIVRAVLEGITFNLFQIASELQKQGSNHEKIYVSGGLARSTIWLKMLADIFGKEIYRTGTPQTSAWGAAWTALVAIEKVSRFEEIKNYQKVQEIIAPDHNNHALYMERYELFKKVSNDLKKYY